MISTNTIFRLLTLAFIALVCHFGNTRFSLILLTAGFAHYILAFIYSRRRLKLVLSDARTMPSFILVTLAGIILAVCQQPVAWLSVFHHNFNEVYMRDAFKVRSEPLKNLRLSSLILNCILFITILRNQPGLEGLNHAVLFTAVGLSAVWYFAMLHRSRASFSVPQLIDSCMYEIVSFSMLALSFSYPLNLGHFFMYHFVFWALYPIPGMIKKGPSTVRTYAAWHIILLPALWALFTHMQINPALRSIPALFGWLGFIHITTSLGLSDEQPQWIIKFFRTQASSHPKFAVEPPVLALDSVPRQLVESSQRL